MPVDTCMTGTAPVFPRKTWTQRSATEAGMVARHVDSFVRAVQGDGCIVKDGYLIRAWGNYTAQGDWASASKPVLGTLLMLAVAEGRLPSLDAPIHTLGWKLQDHHAGITFRHLANMVSGYGRAEAPGTAWAYNDTAINLYAHSLQRLKGTSLNDAFTRRLGSLQFEDGPFFGSREGIGVSASPRDFARLGLFWLNCGTWRGHRHIPLRIFKDFVKPSVLADHPRSVGVGEDYLEVGTYGGSTDQSEHGPGFYGCSFWFNETLPGTGNRVWPSLPEDAFQANGQWNTHTVTVIPSWGLVVVLRGGRMGRFAPGTTGSTADRRFELLRSAMAHLPSETK